MVRFSPSKLGVAAFELGDDAKPVAVVVEAAVARHAGVERVLAGVAERRVAEIMAERDRLGEIVVEPQRPRQRAGDLRHLDRMGEAGAEMVALVMDEHLRLVGEAAEGGRMDDAVAVALELGARRRGRLGDRRPRRAPRRRRKGRAPSAQHPPLASLDIAFLPTVHILLVGTPEGPTWALSDEKAVRNE